MFGIIKGIDMYNDKLDIFWLKWILVYFIYGLICYYFNFKIIKLCRNKKNFF